jgi:NAD(P)H dehydrogenase (quinone)
MKKLLTLPPHSGHIQKLAEAEKEGLKKAGIEADLFQVPETLPQEVLTKVRFPPASVSLCCLLIVSQMHAPPKSDIPVIDAKTLESYDAFLFGIPTRYGNFPAQWKAFWDTTGGQWGSGGYFGKYAGVFISTGTMGGGQESTAIASMSTLAHHGSKWFSFLAMLKKLRGTFLHELPTSEPCPDPLA